MHVAKIYAISIPRPRQSMYNVTVSFRPVMALSSLNLVSEGYGASYDAEKQILTVTIPQEAILASANYIAMVDSIEVGYIADGKEIRVPLESLEHEVNPYRKIITVKVPATTPDMEVRLYQKTTRGHTAQIFIQKMADSYAMLLTGLTEK